MASGSQGTLEWLRGLIRHRPAESVTAFVGGLTLLLAEVVGADADVRTAMVIVVASLPALVSFFHDLGRYGPGGRRYSQRLSRELDELMLRALHRARAGHPGFEDDLNAVTKLVEVEARRSAKPGPPESAVSGTGSGESARQGGSKEIG